MGRGAAHSLARLLACLLADPFTCKWPKELPLIPARRRTTPSSPVRIIYPAAAELSAGVGWRCREAAVTALNSQLVFQLAP